MLKQEFKEGLTIHEAAVLSLRVLRKSMDSTSLNVDKLEVAQVTRGAEGKVQFKMIEGAALESLVSEATPAESGEGAAGGNN